LRPPPIVAQLDLAKPGERKAHDLVRRFSTGRWPLWRLLGMRRNGQTLFIAVEWRRCVEPNPYSLVRVSLGESAMCWRCFPTAAAVRSALAHLDTSG